MKAKERAERIRSATSSVRRKQREGSTIIFVCHDMRLIVDLADFVVVIEDGKVSANAPKDRVISDFLLSDIFKIGIAS